MYRTLRGVLYQDGKIELPEEKEVLEHPVKVMVTILGENFQKETETLSGMGDYLKQLTSYEEKLAKGNIQWK